MTAPVIELRTKTRKPTGKPPWPLILLEGPEKVGKTYGALEFSADERIYHTLVLDLGEGSADEYGVIPGARYDIIEHDGTWPSIMAGLDTAVEDSIRVEEAGGPPLMLVVDCMSMEWDMLKSWVDVRARRQRSNAEKLRKDPDAEIKPSRNIWNDCDARNNRFMRSLRIFRGPVIALARGKWVSATGKDGQPILGEKEYRVEGQKNLGYAANAWVRLSRDEPPVVVGLRSALRGIRPGIDEVKPWSDFSLGELIFNVIGCKIGETAVRNQPELNADQVMPDEIPAAPENTEPDGDDTPPGWQRPGRRPASALREPTPARATAGGVNPAGDPWEVRIKGCGDNLDALRNLWRAAGKGPVRDRIGARMAEVAKAAEAATAPPVAEVKPSTDEAREILAEVLALISAATPTAAGVLHEKTAASKHAQTDVSGFVDRPTRETLGIDNSDPVTLTELSLLALEYVDRHGYSVETGVEGGPADQPLGDTDGAIATETAA